MEKVISRYKATLTLLSMCAFCVGIVLLGSACIPPKPCQTDADCTDGLFCNGEETCVDGACVGGTAPCTAGQECDEDNDQCVATGCETDGDCDDGLFCNGEETCVDGACVAGTDPCAGQECDEDTDECVGAGGCQSDADCDEGMFCDTVTGECQENVNLYATVAFDHDFHQVLGCDSCHHEGAGFANCDTCHDRDEVVGGIIVLKDAMHNPDTGCRQCHEAAFTGDCAKCHTDLDD